MITIDDIRARPTLSIAETAELLEVGLNQAYSAARAGEIPTLRLGRSYRVPVPALLAMLGEQQPPPTAEPAGRAPLFLVDDEVPPGPGPPGPYSAA